MANNFGRAIILVAVVLFCSVGPAQVQSTQVRDVQIQLNANGYDAGPADGFNGPKTRNAISAYQEANGLPATGELDERTTQLLFRVENESGTKAQQADTAVQPTPDPETEPAMVQGVDAEMLTTNAIPAEADDANVPVQPSSSGQDPNETNLLVGLLTLGVLLLGAFLFLRFVVRRIIRLFTGRRSGQGEENRPPSRHRPMPETTQPAESSTREVVVTLDIGTGRDVDRLWEQPRASPPVPSPRASVQAPATQSSAWVPKSGNARVAGRDIGGLVYVGRPPRSGRHGQSDNAFIDPSKSALKSGADYDGQGMSYWPSYASIEPRSRATYLKWLASGRSDPDYNVGYVFLYFYGLERRVFVDRTDAQERAEIIAEVERLLEVYGMNHSIRRYLGAFLEAANIMGDPPDDPTPVFDHTGYDVPANVLLVIGNMAARGEALTADWLLSWYMCHPETYPRTPAKRAFPEFRAYFRHLFDQKFPGGMKLRVPKRRLKLQYHAASGNFVADLAEQLGDVPDVSGFSKPLVEAGRLADDATDALDKFSRYLGRNPDGRGTIEAHALLPEEIWPYFPCAELDDLRVWVAERIADGGLVLVENLVARLEGARPDKIGKRQLTGAADALAKLGIGMAPDPRFALRRPKFGEPVVLFELPEGVTSVEDPSAEYQSSLLSLVVGTMVAHADGRIDAQEEAHLRGQFESNPALPAAERARLAANMLWMRSVPPDLGQIRARLKDAPPALQGTLGQLAVIAAGADGRVDPEEVKVIERLYKTMGLDNGQVYSDIHALTTNTEPITVRNADASSGEYAIPAAPVAERSFTLDASRISSVLQDTAKVANVLGDIFSDDDPDEEMDEVDNDEQNDVFAGLDCQHRPVAAVLITRESWSEEEFQTLTAEHQLMPSGALETINEWAFDRFGDALIEEYDGFDVNPEVAEQLMR